MAVESPSGVYRANITRVIGNDIYVEIPPLGANREFGPITTGGGFEVGNQVVVATIRGFQEDIALVGGSGRLIDVETVRLNDFLPADGPVDVGSTLTHVTDPVNPQDAATKNWVETTLSALPGLIPPAEFSFAVASSTWVMTHGFNKSPVDVTLMNQYDQEMWADVEFTDDNTVTVKFGFPSTGKAVIRP